MKRESQFPLWEIGRSSSMERSIPGGRGLLTDGVNLFDSLHIPGNSDVADRHDELYAESTIARQRGVHGDTRGHDDVLAARGAKVLME